MREKRGQAAMEFLMTYGWALLAIIIIGGLIWIYIGGRECGRVSTGFLGQNIAVEDWTLHANGAVEVSVGNRAPDDVTVDNINNEVPAIGPISIPKGGDPVLIECPVGLASQCGVTPIGNAGECYSEEDLVIDYTVTGGTQHSVSGRVSGSYEA